MAIAGLPALIAARQGTIGRSACLVGLPVTASVVNPRTTPCQEHRQCLRCMLGDAGLIVVQVRIGANARWGPGIMISGGAASCRPRLTHSARARRER